MPGRAVDDPARSVRPRCVYVRGFQEHRGLPVDGTAAPRPGPRWSRPASASAIGSCTSAAPCCGRRRRHLQRQLSALGFDAGGSTASSGPTPPARSPSSNAMPARWWTALGPDTAALARFGSPDRHTRRRSVAGVRERKLLAAARTASRVAGCSWRAPSLRRGDRPRRCTAWSRPGPPSCWSGADDSALAPQANGFDADLFFGVRPGDERLPLLVLRDRGRSGRAASASRRGRCRAAHRPRVEATSAGGASPHPPRDAHAGGLCEPAAHDDVAGTRRSSPRARTCVRHLVSIRRASRSHRPDSSHCSQRLCRRGATAPSVIRR